MVKADSDLPIRLRLDRVDGRSASSLSAFIRLTLSAQGGACTRAQLLEAIASDPIASQSLARGKGLNTVLDYLRRNGFVECDGEVVRRTGRRFGRRRV